MLETHLRAPAPARRPAFRLARQAAGGAARVAPLAGEARVPFTTGLLIGIGETRAERLDDDRGDRRGARRHGHVQEVIVQNFRAWPGTRMEAAPEPSARGARCGRSPARGCSSRRTISVQAPPNLTRRVRIAARRGDRRLRRCLAGDDRPRQPGSSVAGGRAAPLGVRRARARARAAPDRVSALRRPVWIDSVGTAARSPARRLARAGARGRVVGGRDRRRCRSSSDAMRYRSTRRRARRGRDRAPLRRARARSASACSPAQMRCGAS